MLVSLFIIALTHLMDCSSSFCHSLLVVFCCFDTPSWSDCCVNIFCSPFQMPTICEAHVLYYSICIFVWTCFCISGDYLCHHISAFPFIISNFLLSLVVSSITFCIPHASTLFVLLSTCSVVISLVFLIVFYSFIMWVISSALFPFMNCCLSLLSVLLYSHSFSLTLRQTIYSSALSFCSTIIAQYCSETIVSLCWGLNFLISTANSPELVWYFSCSLSVSILANLSPL